MNNISGRIVNIWAVGWPMWWKTTGMSKVVEAVANIWYHTLIVPEAARKIFKAGVKIGDPEIGVANDVFQEELLKYQLAQEDLFRTLAAQSNAEKTLILYDRGILDGQAYMSDPDDMDVLLEKYGMERADVYKRYNDWIIDLVTAAEWAEKWYKTDDERSETAAEAKILEAKIQKAWTGHPHMRVIDNSTWFEEKMNRFVGEILSILWYPAPLEIEHKYLIDTPDEQWLREHAVESTVEQYYLISPDDRVMRIRKRTRWWGSIYTLTKKRRLANGDTVEEEELIDAGTYQQMQFLKKTGTQPIRKKRYNFLWQNQYFELDHFISWPYIGQYMLEIEKTNKEQAVTLPTMLHIQKEVTGQKEYTNEWMAAA